MFLPFLFVISTANISFADWPQNDGWISVSKVVELTSENSSNGSLVYFKITGQGSSYFAFMTNTPFEQQMLADLLIAFTTKVDIDIWVSHTPNICLWGSTYAYEVASIRLRGY